MGRKNARPSRCFEGRAEKSARGSTLIGSLCRAIVQHTVRSGGGLPLPPNQRFSPNRASLDILRQDTLLRHLGRVQYSPIYCLCQGDFRQFFIHDFLCCRGNRACGRPLTPSPVTSHVTWFVLLLGGAKGTQTKKLPIKFNKHECEPKVSKGRSESPLVASAEAKFLRSTRKQYEREANSIARMGQGRNSLVILSPAAGKSAPSAPRRTPRR